MLLGANCCIIGSERNEPQSLLIHCQIQQVLAVHFRHGNLCPSESSCPSSAREQARFTHTKLYIHPIPLNKKHSVGHRMAHTVYFSAQLWLAQAKREGGEARSQAGLEEFCGLVCVLCMYYYRLQGTGDVRFFVLDTFHPSLLSCLHSQYEEEHVEEKERVLGSVHTYVRCGFFCYFKSPPPVPSNNLLSRFQGTDFFLLLCIGGGRRKCPLFSKAKEKQLHVLRQKA